MSYESYYDYIKRRYREMEDERQGDLFRFGFTQCAHCGDLLHQDEAATHLYYDDEGIQKEEVFCPDTLKPETSCHQQWYLKRLNTAGL